MNCANCQHYQPSKWRYTETDFGGNLEKATESNVADRGFCWHSKNMADVSASFNCNFYELSTRILPGKERDETLLERGDGAEWPLSELLGGSKGVPKQSIEISELAGFGRERHDRQERIRNAVKRSWQRKSPAPDTGGQIGLFKTIGEDG